MFIKLRNGNSPDVAPKEEIHRHGISWRCFKATRWKEFIQRSG